MTMTSAVLLALAGAFWVYLTLGILEPEWFQSRARPLDGEPDRNEEPRRS